MKYEIRSTKSETTIKSGTEIGSTRRFDLPDRTLTFARDIRAFLGTLPQNRLAIEDYKQLVRSSGSVGANYLEANESLSKKDFAMRIKISKKECRETIFWLELLSVPVSSSVEYQRLHKEAVELMNILGAILRSTSS